MLLEYKGITTTVVKTDDCYCATDIKLNNEEIKDVLSIHANSLEEIEEAFKMVVDDYLEWLAEE